MREECCLVCEHSLPATAMDGLEIPICYHAAGHEGQPMIVAEEDYCGNYKDCRRSSN